MARDSSVTVGQVRTLWRYPVKSMLGEEVGAVAVDDRGVDGDRRFGVVDAETGKVASAKRPRYWKRLLQLRAAVVATGMVRIHFPDGRVVLSSDAFVDKLLSEFLGRQVVLRGQASAGAELERSVPEAVLEHGRDTDVDFTMLEIAVGSPAGTFFDFSPLQLITSASLDRAAGLHPTGRLDPVRYRPNIMVETPAVSSGFVENDWVGRRLHLGPEVIVEVLVPSPRCAIPTLRHGDLPPDPDAFRIPRQHNFVPVPLEGFGDAPCLGVHVGVVRGGTVSPGDEARLGD